jgi:hypothetical protein
MPCLAAWANARSRLSELPLVDRPSAMSAGRPWASSWRENTTSKPMSLDKAVSTAWSVASERAGSGVPHGGRVKSWATSSASVELPPLPKVKRRPPAAKRSAMAAATVSSWTWQRASDSSRRRVLSAHLASAERARSARSESASRSSASMKG